MTVQTLLKMSGSELEKWYTESVEELWEAEGKSRERGKFDEDHWRMIYQGHETQFQEALDIKFKLAIIKFVENSEL